MLILRRVPTALVDSADSRDDSRCKITRLTCPRARHDVPRWIASTINAFQDVSSPRNYIASLSFRWTINLASFYALYLDSLGNLPYYYFGIIIPRKRADLAGVYDFFPQWGLLARALFGEDFWFMRLFGRIGRKNVNGLWAILRRIWMLC